MSDPTGNLAELCAYGVEYLAVPPLQRRMRNVL